jgi:hypothetical protein
MRVVSWYARCLRGPYSKEVQQVTTSRPADAATRWCRGRIKCIIT